MATATEGTVREKNYILTDPNILGYCIINYGEDNGETDTEKGFLPEGTIQAKSQTESYQRWLNTWYSSLLTTYMGEPLEEDGSFGPKTRQGSLLVWKDILNRLYGKRLSLEGNTFDASCREAAGAALTSYGSSGTLTAIAEGSLRRKDFTQEILTLSLAQAWSRLCGNSRIPVGLLWPGSLELIHGQSCFSDVRKLAHGNKKSIVQYFSLKKIDFLRKKEKYIEKKNIYSYNNTTEKRTYVLGGGNNNGKYTYR